MMFEEMREIERERERERERGKGQCDASMSDGTAMLIEKSRGQSQLKELIEF